MNGLFMFFKHSLIPKAIGLVVFVLIISFGAYFAVSNAVLSDLFKRSAIKSANTTFDIFDPTLRHLMMTNDQPELQRLVASLSKDLLLVQVVRWDCVIRKSSDLKNLDKKFNISGLDLPAALKGKAIDGLRKTGKGEMVYSSLRPIPAEAACYKCHDRDLSVLGAIQTDIDWRPIQSQINFLRSFSLAVALAGIAGLGLLLGFSVYQVIIRRIVDLSGFAQGVTSLEFDASKKIKVAGQDEISSLAGALNKMIDNLAASRTEREKAELAVVRMNEELEKRVEERTAELKRAQLATQHLLRSVKDDKEKIDKLYEDLKGIDRMKTEFMSVISHELRTPLTPVLGYTSFFLEEKFGPLAPQYRESAKIIEKESKHLLALIDSILDVARLERGGQLTLNKEPVFIGTLVDELIDLMRPQSESRQIEIKAELDRNLPALQLDPVKVGRLLTNLLGNALKFTPKGGKVLITGSVKDKSVEVRIADNGIGLAKENLEKIFEKFSQLDSSTTRVAGGLGLGLVFAKEIVEAHGGKIWAESAGLGRGSAFIFTLPIV